MVATCAGGECSGIAGAEEWFVMTHGRRCCTGEKSPTKVFRCKCSVIIRSSVHMMAMGCHWRHAKVACQVNSSAFCVASLSRLHPALQAGVHVVHHCVRPGTHGASR